MPPERFSDKKYVLPFGRYVGSSEVQPPADEVFVGREGQRAYLIDSLISTGRRGAYLVTGRRGTGKSSFVKHCIAEYEASVFSRYLRANVGRGFWDRVLVLFFWMALLLGTLLVSELTQLLVSRAISKGAGNTALLWVFLAPVGVILLFPCVYAKVAIEAMLRAKTGKPAPAGRIFSSAMDNQSAGPTAALIVVVFALSAWFLPTLGSPVLGVGTFIPVVCGLYFVANTISYMSRSRSSPRPLETYAVLFLILLSILGVSVRVGQAAPAPWDILQAQVSLSLVLLGLGLLQRGIYQESHTKAVDLADSLRDAMKSGGLWYKSGSAALLLAGFGLGLYHAGKESIWQLWLPITPLLAAAVAIFWSQSRDESTRYQGVSWQFRPRPGWLLVAKALLSIVVALQLAYPTLSAISRQLKLPLVLEHALAVPDGGRGSFSSLSYLARSGQPLFVRRSEEEIWLVALIALVVVFHFLEYEWILRPFARAREASAFDPRGVSPWDDWEDEQVPLDVRTRAYRNLAELSLPWSVYRNWLPVLPVSVNLGFDKLDHRQVIQAMLVGLRERYQRLFLAWNSGLANLGRLLGFLLLLILVKLTAHAWFPDPFQMVSHPIALARSSQQALPTQGSGGEGAREDSSAKSEVVQKSQDDAEGTVYFSPGVIWTLLKQPLLKLEVPKSGVNGESDLLLCYLLPVFENNSIKVLYFCVYQILLLILFALVGKWLLHRIPLLPYRENLRRIDSLLDSLSTRMKVTSSMSLWGPARWVFSIFSDERVRETERDPVDPRTVELAFLEILEDVQKGGFRFPGVARHHLTMPAPEITFVFDELDKLGTRADPESYAPAPREKDQESELQVQEREREIKLRSLLSDLKNILASAPARFLFVGGRELHDEWLADQTARQPLLTSIFNTEVYLPSLITDHGDRPPASELSLHRRADEYLYLQYYRSHLLHCRSVTKRWRPSFGLPIEIIAQERFAPSRRLKNLPLLLECSTGTALASRSEGEALLKDFARFLTHRSMGNPKKLRDLLASFIRPAGRELAGDGIVRRSSSVQHVLRFGDTEIFRIQLLNDIYCHLALAFEQRMVRRDDKFALSIFFFTDFLFKFHRRAFSWSNLERVDDLANIHRLPDLRDVQEEIVGHFSERFLHRVLNGMYAFRFRSDIAREVEYLSRKSPAEMAAFNFTLDESQQLKAEYIATLKGKAGENPDRVAALGELYEFDQDFERARQQYRNAITLLDGDLAAKAGILDPDSGMATSGGGDDLISISAGGARSSRLYLTWGVTRLRLMLQIGMTFEQSHDLERAAAEYRSSRSLARSLVRAYLDARIRGDALGSEVADLGERSHRSQRSPLQSLEHMNILFQPMFAEAWVAEKFIGSIDTSVSLLEKVLWEVRQTLPFVRNPLVEGVSEGYLGPIGAGDVSVPSHANFSLMVSQLHNKAGDLYFFKGRQPLSIPLIKGLAEASNEKDRATDGYLLRAHYHYAVGLHDLRRYIYYRSTASKYRYSIAKSRSPTLIAEALPDYHFRAVAGSVNDMAEATLARVSMFELFRFLGAGPAEPPIERSPTNRAQVKEWDLKVDCLKWLSKEDEATLDDDLRNWFGYWHERSDFKDAKWPLIGFAGPDTADLRLYLSLKLCEVGARLFADGGYPEDAGREWLQICETVTRYLWWARGMEWLEEIATSSSTSAAGWRKRVTELTTKDEFGPGLTMRGLFVGDVAWGLWRDLATLAIDALTNADRLFRQSRYEREASGVGPSESDVSSPSSRTVPGYLVGKVIPPEALTLLCSLQLGLEGKEVLGLEQKEALSDLLARWTGRKDDNFNLALHDSIQRHRYSMINRLNGMKVLIDHIVLTKRGSFTQALEWTEELLDVNSQFDAPLHFTPLHSGTTCALLRLWSVSLGKEAATDRIYRAAQRDLRSSEEMYTMRRGYYESINDLYYLYDDFNDRQIHFNHAIQMAGAELAVVLRELIDPPVE
jgi:tetratricopeptide (TPR) repeat protein